MVEEPEPENEEIADEPEKTEEVSTAEEETPKKDDAETEVKESEDEESTEAEDTAELDVQTNTGKGIPFGIIGVVVVAAGATFIAIRKKSGKKDHTEREDEQK